MALALVQQSHAEAAGSGFQMEPETLLELAWDSFQALAFRLFPRVFSPCPFQFFWELEMLSSSGLIFSFRLVPLASRLEFSYFLLKVQLVKVFQLVLFFNLFLLCLIVTAYYIF